MPRRTPAAARPATTCTVPARNPTPARWRHQVVSSSVIASTPTPVIGVPPCGVRGYSYPFSPASGSSRRYRACIGMAWMTAGRSTATSPQISGPARAGLGTSQRTGSLPPRPAVMAGLPRGGCPRPPWRRAERRTRVLRDRLARDADIFELVSGLAPLHPRDNTFAGEVFLDLALHGGPNRICLIRSPGGRPATSGSTPCSRRSPTSAPPAG
jgi:hypothetical protein